MLGLPCWSEWEQDDSLLAVEGCLFARASLLRRKSSLCQFKTPDF